MRKHKQPPVVQFAAVAKSHLDSRVVTRHYAENLTRVATRAGTISADRINAFLKERLGKVAPVTARAERTMLISLWRSAYENGIVDEAPRGVMRIKSRKPPTKAWTVEDLQMAIAKTADLGESRLRSGASLGAFLRCWFLLGYESGSRWGDIWRFTADNIEGDVLRWTMSKTGDGMTKLLSPACLASVHRMLAASPDGRILGWVVRRRQAMRLMREHLTRCGLTGTSKYLRRSGATHIEIQSPGQAKAHLGHRSPGLAESSYLDWGQIRRNSPQPPMLVVT